MSANLLRMVEQKRAREARAETERRARAKIMEDAEREVARAIESARGPRGPIGPMPEHEWNGSRLRFEIAPNQWGEWTDLQGPPGARGARGPKGEGGTGEGGGIDVSTLSPIPDPALSDNLILERDGAAYLVSVESLNNLFAGTWTAPETMNGGHADSEQTLTVDGGTIGDTQDLDITGGPA